MRRLTADDIKDIQLFKYYRLVRKAYAKNNGLTDAELELLIYLDCVKYFDINGFKDGTYTYSWNKLRWLKLRKNGFIDVWKSRDRKASKTNTYTVSLKTKRMVRRIYEVLLGEKDLPTSKRSAFYKNKSYTDKVFNKAIDDMIKDPER